MSQTHTEEKEEKEDSLSPSPSTTKETSTDNTPNDNKIKSNNRERNSIKKQKIIDPSSLSSLPKKKPNLSSSISQSTNNLLSANL